MADIREKTMFKQVPGGYVFRAPNQWVLGRDACYLVDEAQKAELVSIVTARSQAFFWMILIGLVAGGSAAIFYASGHDSPTARDATIALGLIPVYLYAALVITIRPLARRLEPVLAGLPRTDQEFTAAELQQAVQKGVSLRGSLLLAVSQGVLAPVYVALAIAKVHARVAPGLDGMVLIYAFAAAVFGISAISFATLAVRKSRGETR